VSASETKKGYIGGALLLLSGRRNQDSRIAFRSSSRCAAVAVSSLSKCFIVRSPAILTNTIAMQTIMITFR